MFFVDTVIFAKSIAWIVLPVCLIIIASACSNTKPKRSNIDMSNWSEADRIEYLERNFK